MALPEGTVGTGEPNHLFRLQMFPGMTLNISLVVRTGFKVTIVGQTFQFNICSWFDPGVLLGLSFQMITPNETFVQMRMLNILMKKKFLKRPSSEETMKTLILKMTMMLDDMFDQLLHTPEPCKTIATSQTLIFPMNCGQMINKF